MSLHGMSSRNSIVSARALRNILLYAVLTLSMIPFMFPFLWMILTSLKSEKDIWSIPPKLIFSPTLINYEYVLRNFKFPQYFLNSLVIGLGAGLLGLALGLPAAFSIARYRQKGVAFLVLLARIIPGMSLLLPWYVIFTYLGLSDTYFALILTHLAITLPLTIWIMIGFFEEVPRELEDAALIDGCSLSGVFRRVALPICVPGIVVSFLLGFAFSWNNFLLSAVVGGPQTRTLPVIAYMQIGMYRTEWGAMPTTGILITLPVLIMTLFIQRYIIRGLAFGAIKG